MAVIRPRNDPREVPRYSVGEAAAYLRIHEATLRSWVVGRSYPVTGGREWSEPLIAPAGSGPTLLSFVNMVEAHVLIAIRSQHGVRMQRVRPALEYVERELQVSHPLAHQTFQTDGVDLFVEQAGAQGVLVNVSRRGQTEMGEVLRTYLRRIERDERGLAVRLFPFVRAPESDPQLVVIDPRFAFGRPMLRRCSVRTDIVAQRFRAGDSTEDLARDYGCLVADIEEALRYETAA